MSRAQTRRQKHAISAYNSAPGFTLIELVIAVGIIMVLAALLLPVLNGVKEKARTVFCMNNLRQIYIPVRSYVLDNNGSFPPFVYSITLTPPDNIRVKASGSPEKIRVVGSYPDPDIFQCPSEPDPEGITYYDDNDGEELEMQVSYGYNLVLVISDVKMSRVTDQAGVALIFDGRTKGVQANWEDEPDWYEEVIRKRHDNRLNIIFVDGHAKTLVDTTDEMFAY